MHQNAINTRPML